MLKQVTLEQFLKSEQGKDTPLFEKASHLSGGQCQRLALARALLHDSPIYIFPIRQIVKFSMVSIYLLRTVVLRRSLGKVDVENRLLLEF